MDDETKELLKEIKNAHDRRDALKYFDLCGELGLREGERDEDLFSRGQAEQEFLSRPKDEEYESSDIETRVRDEDRPKYREQGPLGELYDKIKKTIEENKEPIMGDITCHPNGYVLIKGGWVAHLIHNFLGKKYSDIFVDYEHEVDIREALDSALENMVYNLEPILVKKIRESERTYHIQIEDSKERKYSKSLHERYESFLGKIKEAKKFNQVFNVPFKKRLLQELSSKYKDGGKLDLNRRGDYNRAERIEKYFDIEVEKAEEERRTR